MNGISYGLGDAVDTKNIEVRRLRQMYDARIIDVAQAVERSATKPKAVKAEKPHPPKAPETPPAQVGTGLRAEHRGFGRYFLLDEEGNEVAGPMSKEDADARLAAAVA